MQWTSSWGWFPSPIPGNRDMGLVWFGYGGVDLSSFCFMFRLVWFTGFQWIQIIIHIGWVWMDILSKCIDCKCRTCQPISCRDSCHCIVCLHHISRYCNTKVTTLLTPKLNSQPKQQASCEWHSMPRWIVPQTVQAFSHHVESILSIGRTMWHMQHNKLRPYYI